MMRTHTILLVLFMVLTNFTSAQDITSLDEAAMATEKMLDQNGEETAAEFVENYMASPADMAATIDKILSIRKELKGLRDNIGLNHHPKGAVLILGAGDVEKQLLIEHNAQTGKITNLTVSQGPEKLKWSLDKLDEEFRKLEADGFAGLVSVVKDGELKFQKGFGMANDERQLPNTPETIFAIGSRPIDFTVAAIMLLEQQGKLQFNDPINSHFENVPPDKEGMTINHLLTGRSGLPDFFHKESDWDADLHYIDRNTAVNRLLNQNLLFKPGTSRSHSHGAFGLLAALVEIKSGMPYMEFLSKNFFIPAGMTKTGEYGDRKNFKIEAFAVGGGPQFIGLPNIPPNWGPTSWLVKGSGGMYSTLGDLQRFYKLVRHGDVLNSKNSRHFKGASANVDGSVRGFELFSAYTPPGNEVYLFLNKPGDLEKRRQVFRALEELIR